MDDLWLYTTPQAQILFNVKSEQTVRNWAKEFAQYLSIHANPDDGGNYRFTVEDMAVLALVSEHSAKRTPFVDIHAILQSGQRGDKPTVAPDDMQKVTAGDMALQLQQKFEGERDKRLEVELILRDTQTALANTQAELKEAEKEIIQLETRLERVDKAESEIETLRQRIEEQINSIAEMRFMLKMNGIDPKTGKPFNQD